MNDAEYEAALKFACKQRNELREQKRLLLEACYQYQIERDEARRVASNYRDKYVGRVGSDGSNDILPWEAGHGDD